MSVPDGLLWALGTLAALLAMQRQTRPAPVPVRTARSSNSAPKEE